ncbi:MAG: hypothetical protein WCH34_13295 [Bacteroidota bacterium]
MDIEEDDLSIDELARRDCLSLKACIVCKENDLFTLKSLVDLYKNNNYSFQFYKCYGLEVFQQLERVCRKYFFYFKFIDPEVEERYLVSDIFNRLTPLQKNTLIKYTGYLITFLSSFFQFKFYKISDTTQKDVIIEKLILHQLSLDKTTDFREIDSSQEFKELKNSIFSFIKDIIIIKDVNLDSFFTKRIIKNCLESISDNLVEQLDLVCFKYAEIRLFAFIKRLIDSGLICTQVENTLFQYMYTNEFSPNNTLSDLSKLFNKSISYVNNKRERLNWHLNKCFSFIPFIYSHLTHYGLNNEDEIIVIKPQVLNEINAREAVNFTHSFMIYIFGVLFRNTHALISLKSAPLPKEIHDNYYFIRSVGFKNSNITNFILEINFRKKSKFKPSFPVKLDELILKHFKLEEQNDFSKISKLCKTIVEEVFELEIDNDNIIIFNQNEPKFKFEYYYKILDENGSVMRLKDIVERANVLFPFINANEGRVRSIMLAKPKIFISISNRSTYGLRKWENESLKGGRIWKFAQEYLQNETEPKHISEITEYINKFQLNTYIKSVIANLQAQKKDIFVFYNGQYVGLKSKKYKVDTSKYVNFKGMHFTFNAFREFNNCEMSKVIMFFMKKYNYTEAQVKCAIKTRIDKGLMSISNDNKLIIHEARKK